MGGSCITAAQTKLSVVSYQSERSSAVASLKLWHQQISFKYRGPVVHWGGPETLRKAPHEGLIK